MDTTDDLHALLDACAGLAPIYGPGYNNHVPMALAALHGLGATGERLRAFHAKAAAGMPRLPHRANGGVDESPKLGDLASYAGFVDRFEREIASRGAQATIARAWAELGDGPGSSLFHGLIRTAHGFAVGHDGEVARSLALWSSRFRPLDATVAARDRLVVPHVEAWLDAGLDPADAARRLAAAMARLYAATGDFVVLHLVTGSHALLTLLPAAPDPRAALRAFAIDAATAQRTTGVEPRLVEQAFVSPNEPIETSPADWQPIVAAAIAGDDEHDAKIVHACRMLDNGTPGSPFLAAASRAMAATR